MIKKLMFLMVAVVLGFNVTQAQTHAVYGVVTTFDSIPLIGVDVEVKSSSQVTQTDSLGKFSVICEDKDRIKVSAKGFVTENIKITPELKVVAVNLSMKTSEKQREYAIGYGYISEKDRTTAISNLKNSDTDFSKFNDMFDLLRSMGAQVVGNDIVLRGSTSFQGNSSALIVVDEVITDASFLRTLDPKEVKDVNLIKDGGAAVYGSRGTNGVVLIETKKGGDN
jgi:TonB-dependent SusC/RagA subfamily outer membrane receptor